MREWTAVLTKKNMAIPTFEYGGKTYNVWTSPTSSKKAMAPKPSSEVTESAMDNLDAIQSAVSAIRKMLKAIPQPVTQAVPAEPPAPEKEVVIQNVLPDSIYIPPATPHSDVMAFFLKYLSEDPSVPEGTRKLVTCMASTLSDAPKDVEHIFAYDNGNYNTSQLAYDSKEWKASIEAHYNTKVEKLKKAASDAKTPEEKEALTTKASKEEINKYRLVTGLLYTKRTFNALFSPAKKQG